MTRKSLPGVKGKLKTNILFPSEKEQPSEQTPSAEERCTRLQRQLNLLQREYARLAEENERLTDAASLSPAGFCEVNSRGTILAVNAVFAAMVKTDAHTLRGTSFVSFLPDSAHQQYLSFIHHVIHTDGAQTIRIPIVSDAGHEILVQIDARSSNRGHSPSIACVITPATGAVLEELIRRQKDELSRKNKALHKDVEWHIGMKKLLEASERQFRMLWERSFDGMKLVNESGVTVLVNDAYCRLAGMPRDMLIGKPATIVYAPEERPFFSSLNAKLQGKTAETMTIERQLRLWDDRIVWLELLATPFPGEENRRFMLVIVRDITARKRIEEKIILLNTALENRLQDRLAELDVMNTRLSAEMRERIESEEWIRNFLQYCPIVMYIKDARACMVMANKNFESMFGMNPSAIIGKTNKEVWGEELGEVIDRQDFDVLKNAAPKEYLDTINGRNFLTIKFPIVRKDLPPLLGSYVQDVTEIIAEERAMKLSRQFFERIVNALGDLVCVKDVARRYVLVNDSFVDFVGIDRQDIIGKSDRELFDPDIAEMIESGDDAVFEKQREFLIEELLPRRDGTQRRILVKKDIYFDEHDQPFIVNVIRDITELRQEEEEIRTALAREKELSELKSRFVSMVSHEYKTPLTAILSSAELLELFRKSWSDEKVNGHLQKIKRAVETMIEMISDALFLNKMDTGRLIVSPNTFELVSFCIMIADEIQACAPVQNKIEFSSNVTNVVVSVDNKLLRYIFTNLLSNAVKYSYADSPIQFELAISGQSGIFRIRNRGIGIPQSHRERLFEPFFRAPNTGTIQGTGLGLSIVKRCVDSLQGTIEVDSEQNGETMFTVTVPMPLLKQRPGVAYTKGAASD